MIETVLDDRVRGCEVTYEPGYLDAPAASALFAELRSHAPFGVEAPVLFGRAIPVRRQSCAFGEPGTRYRYSGLLREALPWPEALRPLVEKLRQREGVRFDFALCNLYPDGAAGLGWHADDERDLLRDAPIASISLGETRDFVLRRGRAGPACAKVALGHGSLLVMRGATQRWYQHAVPKRARCAAARINLTFRVMAREVRDSPLNVPTRRAGRSCR